LQRWRYATTSEHVAGSKAVLLEAPAALVLAGESFGGGKVEGAWLSGVHAASLLGAI
jgi:predicted NAD/FAD-dependent oxidoreductase